MRGTLKRIKTTDVNHLSIVTVIWDTVTVYTKLMDAGFKHHNIAVDHYNYSHIGALCVLDQLTEVEEHQ